jgi:hypothetical protein
MNKNNKTVNRIENAPKTKKLAFPIASSIKGNTKTTIKKVNQLHNPPKLDALALYSELNSSAV